MTDKPIKLYKVLKQQLRSCPEGLGGGSYLPQNALDNYLREPYITATCAEEDVPNDLFATINTSATKIFAVLLLANHVSIIGDLLRCGLQDKHLPLSLDESEETLTSSCGTVFRPLVDSWPDRFFRAIEEFLEKQWLVKTPFLNDGGGHYRFDAKHALPFVAEYQSLGVAVTQQVFDCTIHPGHFRSVDDMASTLRNDEADGFDKWQTVGRRVAVKRFTQKDDFEREMKALRAMREKEHSRFVRYLSTWEKSNCYYILLPWADGSTLNNFWQSNNPESCPRDRHLIRSSLHQLLQLADALRVLHSLNFRHGDLKPDNILHFTDRSGRVDNFVIADLGVSKHHHLATGLRSAPTLTRSTTAAYEAPEVFTDAARNLPRPRKYDIWSMGCIILEYIIWLLWDCRAVRDFAESRGYPSFAFYRIEGDGNGATTAVVNPDVVAAMNEIRADPRCAENTALRDLVDIVDRGLLVVDLHERIEAAQLHTALNEIARKASAEEGTAGDEYVLPSQAGRPAMRPALFGSTEVPAGAETSGTGQS